MPVTRGGYEMRFGIDRTRRRFRIELHADERELPVTNAFIRTVVEIPKPRQPARRQRPLVHGIAVILGRDVAA